MLQLRANQQAIAAHLKSHGYTYADPGSISKHLYCSLTLEVLTDPVVTDCDHLFERIALQDWIEVQGAEEPTCPVCRAAFAEDELKSACRAILNMLNELPVKCVFDGECNCICPRSSLQSHLLADCRFVLVACPESGCKFVGRRNAIAHHNTFCAYKRIRCRFCGALKCRKDLRERAEGIFEPKGAHFLACPKRPRPCAHCAAEFPSDRLAAHQRLCDHRAIGCTAAVWGCPASIKIRDKAAHDALCPYVQNLPGFLAFQGSLPAGTLTDVIKTAHATSVLRTLRNDRSKRPRSAPQAQERASLPSALSSSLPRAKPSGRVLRPVDSSPTSEDAEPPPKRPRSSEIMFRRHPKT